MKINKLTHELQKLQSWILIKYENPFSCEVIQNVCNLCNLRVKAVFLNTLSHFS